MISFFLFFIFANALLAHVGDIKRLPRREVGTHFEYRLASKGYWNTYLTIGGVYQQYYESVLVWGIQAGLVFRIFSPPIER